MTLIIREIQPHWVAVYPYLLIENEQDYERAIEQLNQLLDEVGTDETHPMYSFLDILGTIIHLYEEKHYPLPSSPGSDILHDLMEEHGLNQSDLPEVGSQGVVSEILSGKRELNVRQIRELAKRFNVSPAVFI